MKKLIGLGVLLVACRGGSMSSTPTPSAGTTGGVGAATARTAVDAFMAAVKAEDLQALGAIWGTQQGPAREQMSRADLEMREYYIVKCLRHDKYTILSDAGAPAGARVFTVQLTYGPLTRSTNFSLVPGPQNRWYVRDVELKQVDDICLKR